jgi:predicted RNA binding protein YcfA (HicA-like mRNA interferase family)
VKVVAAKSFAKTLEKHGWVLLRIAGSHHIYGKTGSINRISLPIHGHKALKAGLLRHLMKVAELPEEDV